MKWVADCVCNVTAHAQKSDFVFLRNGRVHLNRWGRQISRLLAAEVCASAVVMLDTPCSEVVWRVLATHFICPLPLHFPSCTSPCTITFQLDSNNKPWPQFPPENSRYSQQKVGWLPCAFKSRNFQPVTSGYTDKPKLALILLLLAYKKIKYYLHNFYTYLHVLYILHWICRDIQGCW